MAVTLNHTIVHAHDTEVTAYFLTELLGLPAHRQLAHFTVVQVGETSLDLIETEAGGAHDMEADQCENDSEEDVSDANDH